jgi:hypothetical protein
MRVSPNGCAFQKCGSALRHAVAADKRREKSDSTTGDLHVPYLF